MRKRPHPDQPPPSATAGAEGADNTHGELVLYATEDGATRFYLRAENGSVWLSQLELAALFQTSVSNINIHIKNVLAEGELQAGATIKDDLMVRTEGTRQVRRPLKLYNLDMILAIGYRVKSPRGTQFRQWATNHLREYLVKGFVMDDARLKDPAGWDHFDELLERIRDIRTSEKRFYQKIRDLFALSVDYRDDDTATGQFFAMVQNKMLYAVTQKTAAQLIVERADPDRPNMALTGWKAGRVRKTDVIVAKNYLHAEEITQLNRIAAMFLDYAEDRTSQRHDLRMDDWRQYVDRFVEFNERPLLKDAGTVSHERMQQIVHERYALLDAKRRKEEALAADKEDIKALESVERLARKGGSRASE
ncbi:virulence RhuM family protein [Xanthomonas nasturtii]|uniref:virulence RhuM family protein n=1 Tax=Xanthomonas nasturtii TaxID=1843581 RepID=UPI000A552088|nr:virulence RhuM family protein [Xanthomonas nasturtii]MCL1530825.1 virulence RhuM family protein [Xanthomonas nasturtii]MCL1565682.1 virulence RhuM family protein [Xanthomonas nasturtii]MCL1569754.1 virulence RhuM family protein [Xanthomonas nasturtii]MCL1573534.1 virulence RhuM family protein [Xanthomonas nasturtii]MCL1581280.1 virulence RhuM family protein [Xanthomonas nasturtii]